MVALTSARTHISSSLYSGAICGYYSCFTSFLCFLVNAQICVCVYVCVVKNESKISLSVAKLDPRREGDTYLMEDTTKRINTILLLRCANTRTHTVTHRFNFITSAVFYKGCSTDVCLISLMWAAEETWGKWLWKQRDSACLWWTSH